MNSFILYNLLAYQAGQRTITENDYRNMLVLQIVAKYGREQRDTVTRGRPPKSSYRIRHGSILYSAGKKGRCQYCKLVKKENFTHRENAKIILLHPLSVKQQTEIATLNGINHL